MSLQHVVQLNQDKNVRLHQNRHRQGLRFATWIGQTSLGTEPTTKHMKTDSRLGRLAPKCLCEALQALLCGAGHHINLAAQRAGTFSCANLAKVVRNSLFQNTVTAKSGGIKRGLFSNEQV
jgi:hypothetical protein